MKDLSNIKSIGELLSKINCYKALEFTMPKTIYSWLTSPTIIFFADNDSWV